MLTIHKIVSKRKISFMPNNVIFDFEKGIVEFDKQLYYHITWQIGKYKLLVCPTLCPRTTTWKYSIIKTILLNNFVIHRPKKHILLFPNADPTESATLLFLQYNNCLDVYQVFNTIIVSILSTLIALFCGGGGLIWPVY